MTTEQANLIYTLLIAHCGATEYWRENFVDSFTEIESDCREYRFCGSLGFGGKFYNERDRWRVSCYPEDETPERLAKIAVVNRELAALKLTD